MSNPQTPYTLQSGEIAFQGRTFAIDGGKSQLHFSADSSTAYVHLKIALTYDATNCPVKLSGVVNTDAGLFTTGDDKNYFESFLPPTIEFSFENQSKVLLNLPSKAAALTGQAMKVSTSGGKIEHPSTVAGSNNAAKR